MDMKTAKRLKPGDMVREAWDTGNAVFSGHSREGIVIGKKYVEGLHEAKILGGKKPARYDIVVHWFPTEKYTYGRAHGVKVCQNWEIMLVSSS